jgi:hypothetical protein
VVPIWRDGPTTHRAQLLTYDGSALTAVGDGIALPPCRESAGLPFVVEAEAGGPPRLHPSP